MHGQRPGGRPPRPLSAACSRSTAAPALFVHTAQTWLPSALARQAGVLGPRPLGRAAQRERSRPPGEAAAREKEAWHGGPGLPGGPGAAQPAASDVHSGQQRRQQRPATQRLLRAHCHERRGRACCSGLGSSSGWHDEAGRIDGATARCSTPLPPGAAADVWRPAVDAALPSGLRLRGAAVGCSSGAPTSNRQHTDQLASQAAAKLSPAAQHTLLSACRRPAARCCAARLLTKCCGSCPAAAVHDQPAAGPQAVRAGRAAPRQGQCVQGAILGVRSALVGCVTCRPDVPGCCTVWFQLLQHGRQPARAGSVAAAAAAVAAGRRRSMMALGSGCSAGGDA